MAKTEINIDSPSFKKEVEKVVEKEKPTKVVKAEVTQKKTLGRKITETFTHEDTHSIGEYLVLDILIPAFKDCVSDLVKNATDLFLYGDARGRGESKKKTDYAGASKVSYRSGSNEKMNYSHNARASADFSDIVMQSRADAIAVLNGLKDRIEEYDMATVADFYELVGISSEFTDNNYGWTNLDSAYVNQVRGGYIIVLPKHRYLD